MDTEEFEKKYVNKIIHGNNLEIMKTFPNDCVDFVMSSPPYWSLRSYPGAEIIWDGKEDCEHDWDKSSTLKKGGKGQNKGLNNSDEYHKVRDSDMQELTQGNYCNKCNAWKGELGLEQSFHDFVRHLLIITDEIKRILKPTGSFYLNISDTYLGAHGSKKDDEFNHKETVTLDYEKRPNVVRKFDNFKYGGKEGLFSLRGKGSDNYNSKCLCGIPERVMLGMIDQGWILRNKVIWFKKNSMPSSVKDRLNNTWEYIYHFVKSNKKQYWVNSKTMQLITQQPPTPSTGKEGVDWDWEEIDIYTPDDNKKQDMAGNRTYVGFNARWENKTDKKLKKVSNWRGWDYFYDLDAIRVPHKQASIERVLSAKQRKTQSTLDRKVDKNIDAIPQRSSIDEIVVDLNPAGRNHGDVLQRKQKYDNTEQFQPIRHKGGYISHGGKNPGDFWSINTQPFPMAHFAVFPEAIVINPLKSSCPKEVCVKCGMPKVRVNKKIYENAHSRGDKYKQIEGTNSLTSGKAWKNGGWNELPALRIKDVKNIGCAQCSCNAYFKPGIAFDPFAGSGTTLLVAKRLSYRFIGTEIVKDYVIMAKKRLGINDYYISNSLDDFTEKICQIKPTQ